MSIPIDLITPSPKGKMVWKTDGTAVSKSCPEHEGHEVIFQSRLMSGPSRFVAECGGLPFHADICDNIDSRNFDEITTSTGSTEMILREKPEVRIFEVAETAVGADETVVILEEVLIPAARGLSLAEVSRRFKCPIITEISAQ